MSLKTRAAVAWTAGAASTIESAHRQGLCDGVLVEFANGGVRVR